MSRYTQKAIMAVFQDMLVEMPFDKITVSALAKRCDISHNTFYYHYRDIYDLLDKWLILMKEKYVPTASNAFSWRASLRSFLQDVKSHQRLVYHLFDSLSREHVERYFFEFTDGIFYEYICQEVGNENVSEKLLHNITEYNSYALLGFFLKFLWNKMDVDIDERLDTIAVMLKGNIKWIIETENNKGGTTQL